MKQAPKIESRTAVQFVEEIRTLGMPRELPTWLWDEKRQWPDGDPGAALVEIFARFMEIVSERLNRVPEKSFLAFLEMIGVGLRSPKAARVPVRFFLSTGTQQEAVVPQGTPLASTGTIPQAFETEKALTVIPSALVEVVTYDPSADSYAQRANVDNPDSEAFPCFTVTGTSLIEHSLYLRQDTVFRIGNLTNLSLKFTLEESASDFKTFFEKLAWYGGKDDKGKYISLPTPDTTIDGKKISVVFAGIPGLKTWEVNGEGGYWIQATTKGPLSGKVPTVTGIAVSAAKLNNPIQPDSVFANGAAVDLNKGGFYPFGDRPKHNDVLHIASSEVFSKTGAMVTISVELTFPVRPNPDIIPTIKLLWEYWDGSMWQELAKSSGGPTGPTGPTGSTGSTGSTETYGFDDDSEAFTISGEKPISFTCPPISAKKENGLDSHWLRVRIFDGNYGEDAKLVPSGSTWNYQPATLRPPFIAKLTLSSEYSDTATAPALEQVLAYNDFAYETPTETGPSRGVYSLFKPFKQPQAEAPALCLGFDKLLPNCPVSMFFNIDEQTEATAPQQGSVKPLISWEYLKGKDKWAPLGVRDETKNLTQPGMVEFIAPADVAKQNLFGSPNPCHWLRVRLGANLKPEELAKLTTTEKDQFKLAGVFTNTVWAVNAVSLQNEVFGSSTASPDQVFKLTRPPILEGQAIEVRELETPPQKDILDLENEGEMNPVNVIPGQTGKVKEIWVRWQGVEHFYLSKSSSRHYVLDRGTGQIRFGNGVNGMIPPPGRDNLRAACYQSGGGGQGNVAAHTVTVLKRAVPHIDRIDNPFPAGGGSGQESLEEVKTRGPLTLKHRDRAVSLEDYEWLAQESSLQVARACCLPARDMNDAGTVRLIIVPDSPDPKPLPTPGLINQVQDYIDARRVQTATLAIIPAKYVDISVTATVIPKTYGDSERVRQRIVAELNAFLHPLTGGPDKEGWAFGRDAYISEFAALIEGIEGVDHIKELHIQIDETPENGGNWVAIAPGELAAAGTHTITMANA